MDFSPAGKLTRLKNALPREYKALDKLRHQRSRLLSMGAGPGYPHKAQEDGWLDNIEDVLPIMRQAAQATAISLAAECPRILVSTTTVDRQGFARHYEAAVNLYSKEMHLEDELMACVANSFYSLGIMKVYMADSVPIWLEESEWMDPGRPYAQNISLHHFVYDTGATAFQHCQFLADRYRVSFNDVVTDTRFKESLRKKIRELGPTSAGDLRDAEPWRNIQFDDTDLNPLLYLADVFIPDEGKIYTYVVDRDFNILIDEPLSEIEWEGQETGPYHFLNLGPVPDKTTPSSPAQNLERLINADNSLFRKNLDQAMEQRTILMVPSNFTDDEINAIRNAKDLSFIRSDAITTPVRIGGPDQNNFAFQLNVEDKINKYSNNLDMRLGLGQSADTASQEQIVAQGVSRAEGYDQKIFVKFVRGVVRELGRLLFTAKTVSFPMTRQIDDYVSVDDPWREAIEEGSRLGEFRDYDLDIEPYSMAYKSPGQRVMELQQTFQELVPLTPLLMQQGLMPDTSFYLKEKSRLLNNSSLERLLLSIAAPEEQAGGGHERTLADTGQHEYIHRSAGGGGGDPGQQQLAMMSAANADNQAA